MLDRYTNAVEQKNASGPALTQGLREQRPRLEHNGVLVAGGSALPRDALVGDQRLTDLPDGRLGLG